MSQTPDNKNYSIEWAVVIGSIFAALLCAFMSGLKVITAPNFWSNYAEQVLFLSINSMLYVSVGVIVALCWILATQTNPYRHWGAFLSSLGVCLWFELAFSNHFFVEPFSQMLHFFLILGAVIFAVVVWWTTNYPLSQKTRMGFVLFLMFAVLAITPSPWKDSDKDTAVGVVVVTIKDSYPQLKGELISDVYVQHNSVPRELWMGAVWDEIDVSLPLAFAQQGFRSAHFASVPTIGNWGFSIQDAPNSSLWHRHPIWQNIMGAPKQRSDEETISRASAWIHQRRSVPLLWLDLTDGAGLPELIFQHSQKETPVIWVVISGAADNAAHSRSAQIIFPQLIPTPAKLNKELALEVGDVLPTLFAYAGLPLLAQTGSAYPEVFRGSTARAFVRQIDDELEEPRVRLHFPFDKSEQGPKLTRAQEAHRKQLQQLLIKKTSD